MTASPSWHRAITAWHSWLIAADRPKTTRRLRMHQLHRFAEWCPQRDPWTVTTTTLIEWLGSQDWSTETRRSSRSALVTFYRWAVTAGHLDVSPAAALPTIKAPNRVARPAPERIVDAALSAADARIRLMLLLASREGMRRGEIARVHSDDLVQTLTGWSLLVHGKGGKKRIVPLGDEIAGLLRALPEGWAFPGRVDGHLSADTVGVYLARALPEGWTGHTLRHRFATVVYAETADLLTLQELLGHSRPETTRGYVQLPDHRLRDAVRAAA